MLILLIVIFVALFILGSWFIEEDGLLVLVQICTVLGAAISLIAFVCVSVSLSETTVIDDMIAMYAEENKNIENQIDAVVSKYMEFEGGTLTGLKSDSAITLVSLYPELKSDELVKTQIATYQANNEKLKELKEKKINTRVYKWWMYFGGKEQP